MDAMEDKPLVMGASPSESSDGLPPPVDDFFSFENRLPKPEDPGLPERPHKRIKEKFRLDRERWERALNAKGDSLYRSKLQPTSPPPQTNRAYPGPFGSGWGYPQSSSGPSNPFGWGGGSQRNPFGWGASHGPSMGSEFPPPPPAAHQMAPTYSNSPQEQPTASSQMNQTAFSDFFKNYKEVGSTSVPTTSEKIPYVEENYPVQDKFTEENSGSFEANDGESLFGNEVFGKGQNPFDGGDIGQDADFRNDVYNSNNPLPDQEVIDFTQEEYNTEANNNEKSIDPVEDDYFSRGYQMRSDQMENSDQVTLGGEEVARDGTSMTVTGAGELEQPQMDGLQRPRKQLKEKFMKDREELEAKLNAKGDSMYRRLGDPIPQHLKQNAAPTSPYAAPGERRFLMPHELRAQMALQKIARAAQIALTRRRKSGKRGGAQVIFI